MIALFKTLQVILAFSLLIFVHELGHFLWSRLFGIKVEKFYLFFDVGGKALWRKRIGQTEYGIGWLPLGGYCKIAGMIDESLDTDQLKGEPQPWEFRTHPAWQRLAVMAGGVLNNFLFAIVAFCLIAGIWGSAYVPNEGVQVQAGTLAQDMGFRTGDRILSLDGAAPEDFFQIQADIARKGVQVVGVLRGADTLHIYVDRSMVGRILNEPLFGIALPFVVDSVVAGSPNSSVLEHGDRIVSVGGSPIEWHHEAVGILQPYAGNCVEAVLLRGKDELHVPIQVDSLGHIGIFVQMPAVSARKYSFLQSIPAGVKKTFSVIGGYVRDLGLVFNPSTKAYKSLGSFIAIGQVFPSAWDWSEFLNIVALLSVMLAVMNLLPIPGLDGGHIVFTVFEMITGRKPSDRFMLISQMIGMAILILLMLVAFGNDIGRLIR